MDLLGLKPHIIAESINDKVFLMYGEPGTRKTTVASQFDGALLAAFEIGYKYISGVIAQPLTSWAEFKQFLRQLKDDKVKETYKVIVIDTVGLAWSACSKYIAASLGVDDIGDAGFGKGYKKTRKEFEESILSIPQMGYGLILIAHAEEMEDKGSVKSKVDIDKRPAAIIKGLADFILYLRHEYKDDQTGKATQTVYAYSNLVEIETKTRARYLSPRFEFTYENLRLELKKAIEEQKKVEGVISVKTSSNLHEIEELDFGQIQLDVITLAQELLKNEATAELANEKIQSMFNIRLSQTTEIHREKLQILFEELSEIKARA